MSKLVVLKGATGAQKLVVLPASAASNRVCFFFPGDQLESVHASPHVNLLQDPKNIVEILSRKFPGAHVVYVSPSRLEAGFACFDHFLSGTTMEGDPKEYNGASFRASTQLASLLRELQASTFQALMPDDPAALELIICGFSKGGVVLNQLLHEFAAAGADPTHSRHVTTPGASALGDSFGSSAASRASSRSEGSHRTMMDWVHPEAPDNVTGPEERPSCPLDCLRFLESVTQMHLLDVGLNIQGAAYITSPEVAQGVAGFLLRRTAADPDKMPFRLFIHGTPRQWLDQRRAHLGIEKETMNSNFAKVGINVYLRFYERNEPATLEQHFRVLELFESIVGNRGCAE